MDIRLSPISVATLDAEEQGPEVLGAQLGARPAAGWPPPGYDPGVRNWFRRRLRDDPGSGQWLGSYIVADIDGLDTLVGTAGYKGPPDAEGRVEIGYGLVEACRGRGIGTAAVQALLATAFADQRVTAVLAETSVASAASRRLLEKCGFLQVGQRRDEEEGDLALYQVCRN